MQQIAEEWLSEAQYCTTCEATTYCRLVQCAKHSLLLCPWPVVSSVLEVTAFVGDLAIQLPEITASVSCINIVEAHCYSMLL